MKQKLLIICLLLSLLLCSCQKEQKEEPPVPKYTLSYTSIWFLGQDTYIPPAEFDFMGEKKSFKLDSKYATSTTIKGDNLIIRATEEQKNALIQHNLELAKKGVDKFKSVCSNNNMEWNEDGTALTITIDYNNSFPKKTPEDLKNMGALSWVSSILYTNRVLSTGDIDTAIKTTIINADSGHIMNTSIYPYEPISFTSEHWEKSLTQDVPLWDSYKGHFPMKMTVKEVTKEKIIFTPEKHDSLYTNDESLCLCLESTYAEDVNLPRKIKKGDVFTVVVDGRYAIHEDGDDIPDIHPLAMIPEKYVKEFY